MSPIRRPVRVLLADDNEDAAMTLAMLLDLAGHATQTANDGEQALELAARHEPEVAILDIGMPGMSGLELARRLRAEPRHRDMILIALTGWGQEAYRRASALAGFNLHLVKPVNSDELLKHIEDLVGDTGDTGDSGDTGDTSDSGDAGESGNTSDDAGAPAAAPDPLG